MEELSKDEKRVIADLQLKKELRREKKLVSFSKRVMFFVMLLAFIVSFYAMGIIFITRNTSCLDSLLDNAFDFAKVGVGFYSAKAMVENVKKYNKDDV